jgi:formylglycine-generating enzyme required for sulfatase activity
MRLTNDGVDAWLDKEKLLPGQDWELEIKKAVRAADVVVVCLSKQFNQRGFRQKEVRLALDTAMEMPEGEIFIIPARLEECENLESLRKWHWVDLFEEKGYERLVRALHERANRIGVTLRNRRNELKQRSGTLPEITRKPYLPIAILGVILVALFNVRPLLNQSPTPSPTVTSMEAIKTATLLPPSNTPTNIPTDSPTPIVIITFTPTVLPSEIMDEQGVPMALVPEGKFTMGSTDNFSNENPTHLVNLTSFYIDKYEVTNRNYNLCVQKGECLPPKKRGSKTHESYFGNPEFDYYPVIYVTWDMARTYCQWRGARLPSEAEWEKAARGADGRMYPWGDTIRNTESNYNGLMGDLAVVGTYNSGVSPYGLFDMAGNAQEWVSDWYQENYYSSLFGDVKNPQGPLTGAERVIRGGSWDAGKNFIRTTYRFKSLPSVSFYNISFRCAKDVTP